MKDEIKLRESIKDILHEHVLDFEDCPEGIDGHFGKCKNYVVDRIIYEMKQLKPPTK